MKKIIGRKFEREAGRLGALPSTLACLPLKKHIDCNFVILQFKIYIFIGHPSYIHLKQRMNKIGVDLRVDNLQIKHPYLIEII